MARARPRNTAIKELLGNGAFTEAALSYNLGSPDLTQEAVNKVSGLTVERCVAEIGTYHWRSWLEQTQKVINMLVAPRGKA